MNVEYNTHTKSEQKKERMSENSMGLFKVNMMWFFTYFHCMYTMGCELMCERGNGREWKKFTHNIRQAKDVNIVK